ncbi:pre-miRNA 5'-monophosphate methyltransferase [Carcharodon carcharias]|uniref:pre-miRNA 5'-monophosphate methyltransferase n=1 Tax=Carcharodon carcharias TaxID=13397 RepID=UPI001B7EBC3B|nr:pre-miRNA 5'-monophosphate methyltransferase [Carcharodon carcharias]
MASPMNEAKPEYMKTENEQCEPGAAPYGNFINYYRFNPPGERLRLIPAADLVAVFPGGRTVALDVGCNCGDFSIAMYKHLCDLKENLMWVSPGGMDLKLLGCDIDADLIQRATESNSFPESISYVTLDVMDPASREAVLKPYLDKFDHTAFDICFCMSVTMWIHLNHGDQGLLDFLVCVSGLCEALLIEPQPWKCYRAAARRLRKLGKSKFDHFKTLSIKGDVAQKIQQFLITDCKMELVRCFGSTSWDRNLLLFKKRSLSHD